MSDKPPTDQEITEALEVCTKPISDYGAAMRQTRLQEMAGTVFPRALRALQWATEDTKRLDKLDRLGDIGEITIDADLAGTRPIRWNKFNAGDVRTAIDAATEEGRG